jgi:hypothetical protein
MDLNELREMWCEKDAEAPMEESQVMVAITTKQQDLRRRVQRRLRREAWNLALPVFYVFAALYVKDPTWKGIAGTVLMLLLLGSLIATVLYKERQLSRAPLAGSLTDSLTSLLTLLDSTVRAYMTAYVVVVTAGLALLAAVGIWKWGLGTKAWLVLVLCAVAAAWSYRSGQRYVECVFGRYRRELRQYLDEVEGL